MTKRQDALRSVLALIATGIVVGLAVFRAYDLGLIADRVSTRVALLALPVCVSDLYRGGRHDFTGFAELRGVASHYFYTVGKGREYRSYGGRLVPEMLKKKITSPGSIMYWGYDDRGLGDYCVVAFSVFGPTLESFSKLWLALLGLSAAAFLTSYRRHPIGPPVLVMFLACAYLGLGLYSFMQEPVSLSDERVFEYLSLLPALHLALFPFLGRRSGRAGLAGLLIQALIFVFLYHARSSIGWQILPVLASISIALLARRSGFVSNASGEEGYSRGTVKTAVLPLLALAGFMVLLMAYTRVTYHPAYFGEEGGRTVFHNALMGLHGMDYDGEPKQAIDDNLIKKNVSMFIAGQRGVPVGEITYVSKFGATYERDARAYYFHLVRKDRVGTARYYLEKKIPASLVLLKQRSLLADRPYGTVRIGDTMRPMGPGTRDYVKEKNLLFSPLVTPISMLSIILAVLFARGRAIGVGPALLVATMFFVAGLIPSTLFYNQDMRQLSGAMLSLGLMTHLAAFWVLTVLWGLGTRLRQTRAPAGIGATQEPRS